MCIPQKTLFQASIPLLMLVLASPVIAADPIQVSSPLDSVGTYMNPLDHVGATGFAPAGSHARYSKGITAGGGTRYSTGVLPNHPYDSASLTSPPTYGAPTYRLQNPASPQNFFPGYGYQPPFVGLHLHQTYGSPSLNRQYHFGNRNAQPRDMTTHRRSTNAYGGPWQFPGSTTNTTPRKFDW